MKFFIALFVVRLLSAHDPIIDGKWILQSTSDYTVTIAIKTNKNKMMGLIEIDSGCSRPIAVFVRGRTATKYKVVSLDAISMPNRLPDGCKLIVEIQASGKFFDKKHFVASSDSVIVSSIVCNDKVIKEDRDIISGKWTRTR